MAYSKSLLNSNIKLFEDIISGDVTAQAYVINQIHLTELKNIDAFTWWLVPYDKAGAGNMCAFHCHYLRDRWFPGDLSVSLFPHCVRGNHIKTFMQENLESFLSLENWKH